MNDYTTETANIANTIDNIQPAADTDRPCEVSSLPSGFCAKSLRNWVDEAMQCPDPKPLFRSLWFEGECCTLFADTNMGKSVLAMQMADEISHQGHRVVYLDFEMSAKQLQRRLTPSDCEIVTAALPDFIRAELAEGAILPQSLDEVVAAIESLVCHTSADVLIIDNITWICNRAESGDAAGELMQLLIALKRKYQLSILCLAHTPKRAITSPLTQNSLAGSKRIANFMDSIFAIGMDRTNLPQGRYIKQIKVRSAEMEYGEDNVIRCELTKTADEPLKFHITGYDSEARLLSGNDENSRFLQKQQVIELSGRGMSIREIAAELGIDRNKVARLINQGRQG